MKTETVLQTLSEEVGNVLNQVSASSLDAAAEMILKAENIFIQGNGRSGLVGKMAAMRLMHSGYRVHVVGESTTPNFTENDLLIILSGSGKGSSLDQMISKVRQIGGCTLLVTAADDPEVTDKFDESIFIKASTKHNNIKTIQPLGNQFDQAMHIVLDALIVSLNINTNTSNNELKVRHFNLE
ncbi:6-phospho-3-hexuloisomerase [Corticicoccus populi]|uniref:6-phospho-3-hexuloisomerase n=1 Tax=Corticicoccus populi TaxID=1812821 RepID=A0ABW5WXE8_9STAP